MRQGLHGAQSRPQGRRESSAGAVQIPMPGLQARAVSCAIGPTPEQSQISASAAAATVATFRLQIVLPVQIRGKREYNSVSGG